MIKIGKNKRLLKAVALEFNLAHTFSLLLGTIFFYIRESPAQLRKVNSLCYIQITEPFLCHIEFRNCWTSYGLDFKVKNEFFLHAIDSAFL